MSATNRSDATDSCEYEYIIATRRKAPRKRGDTFGWCGFALEIAQ